MLCQLKYLQFMTIYKYDALFEKFRCGNPSMLNERTSPTQLPAGQPVTEMAPGKKHLTEKA